MLDSWSVLAYLEDEPAGERAANIIADAYEHGIPLLMSTVNAGEAWYILACRVSEAEADQGIADLREVGIELRDADWKLAHQAARLKVKRKMSFADCFAAPLSIQEKGAALVTGDKEFREVEQLVNIMWL